MTLCLYCKSLTEHSTWQEEKKFYKLMKQKEKDQMGKKNPAEFYLDASVHFIRNGKMPAPENVWDWQLPEKQVVWLVVHAIKGSVHKINSLS